MNTLSFSLPEGSAIHVAGRHAEPIDGEITLSFRPGEASTPFIITSSAGLSEFFEFRLSRLQAARAMRFFRNCLTSYRMRRANTDKDQEPTESH
jgi:hypothetical protein